MRIALALLFACGGGKSGVVKPVPPRTTISTDHAGVGQKVMVTTTWHRRFTAVIDCAECGRVGENADHVIPLRAGPLFMVTHFQQISGGRERADVIDKLQVHDPDPGSVVVTCVDNDVKPQPCPEATGFTVDASVRGQRYSVFVISVGGRTLEPTAVVSEVAIYALSAVPAGPMSIGVGEVTVMHDFAR